MREIVLRVRHSFEQKNAPRRELAKLYTEYNPINSIEEFIETAIHQFPSLCCGVSSVYLRYLLGVGEIVRGTYQGHKHTYLLIEDSIVIDITADQYGGPRVYIGPRGVDYGIINKLWTTKG